MTYAEQFRARLKEEGLTIDDCIRLSQLWGKGELTESKLKRHSAGINPLGPEESQALNRLVAQYRMVMGKAKWVVFEAFATAAAKS